MGWTTDSYEADSRLVVHGEGWNTRREREHDHHLRAVEAKTGETVPFTLGELRYLSSFRAEASPSVSSFLFLL